MTKEIFKNYHISPKSKLIFFYWKVKKQSSDIPMNKNMCLCTQCFLNLLYLFYFILILTRRDRNLRKRREKIRVNERIVNSRSRSRSRWVIKIEISLERSALLVWTLCNGVCEEREFPLSSIPDFEVSTSLSEILIIRGSVQRVYQL
jgi:hypothetical protein